ncbi:MAG: radical SAM protein [Pseudomonadota bacterium]
MPHVVNLEFTKLCNARCGFCSCWQVPSKGELEDYSPIIKKFKPVVVSISGGEPLLRKNYPELIKGIRPYCHFLVIITNGALLNEKSAKALTNAGIDQICVSLDYLSEKHDKARKVEGLFDHISKTVPKLSAMGYRIILNSVIMNDNLDQVIPLVHKAKEWGVEISFSSYCSLKRQKDEHMIDDPNIVKLKSVVEEIKRLKKEMGHIKSSYHYLNRVVEYFQKGNIGGCKAGVRWIQVTPDGHIQPCSELPRTCSYEDYTRDLFPMPSCEKCWYSCRGEAEANPLKPQRLWELMNA